MGYLTIKKTPNNHKVAVVIPTNKSEMSVLEEISYRQCLDVLGKYDTYILCPEDLDTSAYTQLGPVRNYKQPCKYFGTSLRYNKLMLTRNFYQGLAEYEYILIYQLDCYVFRDELEAWCNMGYDYIGAPWVCQDLPQWVVTKKRNYPMDIRLLHKLTGFRLLSEVGNGGLSLRKTSSMIRNLGLFSLRTRYYNGNEDVFMAHYMGALNPFMRIPDTKTALKFAFDAHPDIAFEMNGKNLPFGCHAWWRQDKGTYDHNLNFWQNHIEVERLQSALRMCS